MSNLGATLQKPTWDISTLPVFEKNFYTEHPAVASRSFEHVDAYRRQHEISIFGQNIPKPVESFDEANFPCKFSYINLTNYFLIFIC